jgi:hypothetical protein
MTILSNHRLHSYKATAASHRRVLTPKKTPTKSSTIRSSRGRIIIKFPLSQKISTITEKPTVKIVDDVVKTKPIALIIEGMNIYEDLYGGWNPEFYEALNQEYDLDNSADYEEYLDETDNEELWAHLDYLEWLTD